MTSRLANESRRPLRASTAGFTLIEVLISIALLTFISLFIYQATTESFKVREILSTEGEFYNSIRLAMQVLDRDLAVAYTPLILVAQPTPPTAASGGGFDDGQGQAAPDDWSRRNDPDALALQTGEYARTSQFWGAAISKSGLRPSRFVGTETKLSFVSASHVRVYRDKAESDFIRVEYEARAARQTGASSLVLIKTASPNAFTLDDAKDPLATKVELLDGIERFRFRYYLKSKTTWLNSWDSENSETFHIFPDLVEVAIEVKGSGNLKFSGLYKLKPEMAIHGVPAIF